MSEAKLKTQQFRNFLKTDRAILLLCMGIALIFWLFIKLSGEYRTSREINISYIYPESKTFVDKLPTKMIATIKGIGWDLMGDHFSGRKNKVEIELQDLQSQTIDRKQLVAAITNQLPASIQIEDVSLNYVNVLLDDVSNKKVPILLEKKITPELGFQIKSITTIPDSVQLNGPTILVGNHNMWNTQLLDLQQLKTSQQVQLNLSPSENDQLKLQPPSVQVNVEVEQLTEHSVFIPITVINPPDSLNIFPKKVKVNYVVGLSQFDQVKAEDIKIVADFRYTSLQAEENTIPVNIVSHPNFLKRVNCSPNSVQFYFIKEEKEKQDGANGE